MRVGDGAVEVIGNVEKGCRERRLDGIARRAVPRNSGSCAVEFGVRGQAILDDDIFRGGIARLAKARRAPMIRVLGDARGEPFGFERGQCVQGRLPVRVGDRGAVGESELVCGEDAE